MAILPGLLGIGGRLETASAQPDVTAELRQVLARSMEQKRGYESNSPWTKLRDVVRIEPTMVSVDDGRMRIEVRPLRKLANYEAIDLLADVGAAFKSVLGGRNPPVAGSPVALWLESPEILVGPPVSRLRMNELKSIDILRAIHAYMDELDRIGGWKLAGLAELEQRYRLRGAGFGPSSVDTVGADGVRIWWNTELRNDRDWPAPPNAPRGRRGQAYSQTLFQFELDEKDRAANLWRSLVVNALTRVGFDPNIPAIEDVNPGKVEIGLSLKRPKWVNDIAEEGIPKFRAPGVVGQQIVFEGAIGGAVAKFRKGSVPKGVIGEYGYLPTLQRIQGSNEPPAVDIGRQQLVVDAGGFAEGTLRGLAFSPDSKLLAGAGDCLRIWELSRNSIVAVLRSSQPTLEATGFRDVAFSPDGRHVVVATQGTQHQIWVLDKTDLSRVAYCLRTSTNAEVDIDRLAFSRNGELLATADIAGVVTLWDWASGTMRRQWKFENSIARLQFDHPKLFVLSEPRDASGIDFHVLPIDDEAENGPPDIDFDLLKWINRAGYPGDDARTVVLSPRAIALGRGFGIGDLCVACGRSDVGGESRSYNWCQATRANQYPPDGNDDRSRVRIEREHVEHDYLGVACALSSDLALCASGDARGLVQVWNPKTGTVLHTFRPASKTTYSVAFGDADYRQWKLGRDRYRGSEWRFNHYAPLGLSFNVNTRILSRETTNREPVGVVVRDGKRLSYDNQGSYRRLSLAKVEADRRPLYVDFSGDKSSEIYSYGFQSVAALPESVGAFATFENGQVVCFDVETLRPRRFFSGHSSMVWSSVASADGKRLITTSNDGTIRVWSLENFRDRYNVPVRVDRAYRITSIPNGVAAAEHLRIGDQIVSIQGMAPIAWLTSDQSLDEPPGPVPVVVERGGNRKTLAVRLEPWGDVVKPLVSALISPDGGDWILWTESGFFDASPAAMKTISWMTSGVDDQLAQVVSARQALDQRLRPDIVDLTLKLGDESQAIKAAGDSAVVVALPSPPKSALSASAPPVPLPPELRFIAPVARVQQTDKSSLAVEVAATVPKGASAEITILCGSVALGATNSGNQAKASPEALELPPPPAGHEYRYFRTEISLRLGPNKIQAVGKFQGVESDPQACEIFVTRVAPLSKQVEAQRPRLHWCGIAVNDYSSFKTSSKFQNLRYAVNDVQRVAEAVKERQKSGRFPYREVRFHELVEASATKGKIIELFDKLTVQRDVPDKPDQQPDFAVVEGDTVVLHICGHGGLIPGTRAYSFIPHGGDTTAPASTCVAWSDLANLASVLGTRHVRLVLFLDTCHAGGLGGQDTSEAIAVMRNLRGVVFAACGPKQTALEKDFGGELRHGAFSLALIEAFTGKKLAQSKDTIPLADVWNDGALVYDELSLFLRERVKQLTENEQVPQADVSTGTNDAPLF
jgi:WD40 repeat protein